MTVSRNVECFCYFLVNPLTFKCCLFACLSSLTKWVVWLQALYWWWECSLKSETCLRWCNQQAKKVKTCRWTLLCFMYCCHWWCHRWSINYWKIPLHSFMGIVEIPPGNFGWMDCIPSQSGRGKPFESLSIFSSVFPNFTAFTQCAKSRTVSVVWACRKENQAMKDCMTH